MAADATPPEVRGGAEQPRVVVVGAGFGGLRVVRGLRNTPCRVTLIDRRNHHTFQPLLYQVATAVLSPADIAAPIRTIFRRQENVRVLLGEATRIDLAARAVEVCGEPVRYDWLVLATGVTHAYYGHEEWAPLAPGLKTVEDALEIRRRMLLAFEAAEQEEDPEVRSSKLTFVIVGGGPTGVEMAGALREIASRTVAADYRSVDTTTARVVVAEGRERLLPTMSPAASRKALHALREMGVEVKLETFVTEVEEGGVRLGEERLPAANVIWAAGVRGSPLARTLAGVPLDPSGRVRVERDCSLPGRPEVFVIGDLAAQVDAGTGRPVPGVAQGAIQMGGFVARVIADSIARGEALPVRRPFHFRDKGVLATIGRARAVADLGGQTWSGLPAWVLWSLVHISFLIGFRNRILVMVNWAWQWLFHTRGARLITEVPNVCRALRGAPIRDPGQERGGLAENASESLEAMRRIEGGA